MTIMRMTTRRPEWLVVRFNGVHSIEDVLNMAEPKAYRLSGEERSYPVLELVFSAETITLNGGDFLAKGPLGEMIRMTDTEVREKFEALQ